MRITGGLARGVPLTLPRGSAGTRPATDRMREAVFSSLGARVEGAQALDLFAGSGAYGLEALSRGAHGCTFVEKSRVVVAALEVNLKRVLQSIGEHPSQRAAGQAGADVLPAASSVQLRDALRWDGPPHSLVFLDPPYTLTSARTAELGALAQRLVEPGGLLVWELPGALSTPEAGWRLHRRLGSGRGAEPAVVILERTAR